MQLVSLEISQLHTAGGTLACGQYGRRREETQYGQVIVLTASARRGRSYISVCSISTAAHKAAPTTGTCFEFADVSTDHERQMFG